MTPPAITTPRLRLVAMTAEAVDAMIAGDAAALAAATGAHPAGPVVAPPLMDDALPAIRARLAADPGQLGWWSWLVLRSGDGVPVGSVGLGGTPDEGGDVVMGYSIYPEHERHGFAAEAAAALADWALQQPGVSRVVATVPVGYDRSRRVAERAGMTEAGRDQDPEAGEVIVYERRASASPAGGSRERGVRIRPATIADARLVLAFIEELAEYERLRDACVATVADIERTLFGTAPAAEVVIAELDGEAVGFALFFATYSTFLARPGIHLEDLFVRPAARGRGVGRRLLAHLARLVVERGGGRLEWAVLDWNEPAIRFYRSLGAAPMDEWTTYRVAGDELGRLGGA